jgi:hypothetical protein
MPSGPPGWLLDVYIASPCFQGLRPAWPTRAPGQSCCHTRRGAGLPQPMRGHPSNSSTTRALRPRRGWDTQPATVTCLPHRLGGPAEHERAARSKKGVAASDAASLQRPRRNDSRRREVPGACFGRGRTREGALRRSGRGIQKTDQGRALAYPLRRPPPAGLLSRPPLPSRLRFAAPGTFRVCPALSASGYCLASEAFSPLRFPPPEPRRTHACLGPSDPGASSLARGRRHRPAFALPTSGMPLTWLTI